MTSGPSRDAESWNEPGPRRCVIVVFECSATSGLLRKWAMLNLIPGLARTPGGPDVTGADGHGDVGGAIAFDRSRPAVRREVLLSCDRKLLRYAPRWRALLSVTVEVRLLASRCVVFLEGVCCDEWSESACECVDGPDRGRFDRGQGWHGE